VVGEVTAGEISSTTKNIGNHLDVLSLEYMEKAQLENLSGDNENTGPSFGANQGRTRFLQYSHWEIRVATMSILLLFYMFLSLRGFNNVIM
jgi:hypothetical protein